ncbi:tRNA pseudouridine(38-40) synthase TruA [Isachenkonia alkalipeptolytica]|uniref:tRNA pseudouridine synthase A n=1 Tax=Isachenkonia alkalipeptolytica TaxID=2565777 RepID=A0AA43XM29_9CLOT|nr:tRNA pseudouridine(38-40) synthase TruA [Isachenkonia alkalipeptolytica]NBG88981.1 tRNA pseudouridine(38-40) synthase TruA [Isachenkonia alkalipeptolytica]
MRNILLNLAYDGTNYSGWQIQPNGVTIEEKLMEAFRRMDGSKVKIIGSGRTDARVHARGQRANVHLNSSVPTERLPFALNAKLPPDIVVTGAREVPLDFHARYDALGKTYRYRLYTGPFPDPIGRNYQYHVKEKLEMEGLREALEILKGTHDFRGFMASGSSVKTTTRTIEHVEIRWRDGGTIDVYISANGFLYNMVRIIIGSMVDVAKGKITRAQLEEALKNQKRALAGHTAPPQGLFLEEVRYKL